MEHEMIVQTYEVAQALAGFVMGAWLWRIVSAWQAERAAKPRRGG